MNSLCIKTNNSNLLDYLQNELKNIDLDNICFSENQFKNYKNIIIHYNGKNSEKFYDKMSSLLSFLIIDEIEETLLKKILLQNFFYFDSNERNQILEICLNMFIEDFSHMFDEKFKYLYTSFLDFISFNKSIILEGFINFRLQKYMKFLDTIINEAVNTFLLEKEYKEFISLLRLYTNSQPSKYSMVHIIYSDSNSILLDENKNKISIDKNIFNAKYLSDISFSSNDYTLNSLLTLLPQKIFIHLVDNNIDEFINTLQLVFEKKIHLCTNCNICNLFKKEILR